MRQHISRCAGTNDINDRNDRKGTAVTKDKNGTTLKSVGTNNRNGANYLRTKDRNRTNNTNGINGTKLKDN